jgi:hypothetical protein
MEEALECANAIKGGSASIYHTTGVVYGPGRDAGHLVHHQNMGWIKCAWHVSTSSSYRPRTERCRLFDQSLASAETRLRWVQHAAGPTATTHAMCMQSDCARVEVLDLHASAPHLIVFGSGVTYRHRKQKSAQHKRCDPHRGYRLHPPCSLHRGGGFVREVRVPGYGKPVVERHLRGAQRHAPLQSQRMPTPV